MKEIKVELGHAIRIKNQYTYNVMVGRNAKGYYIIEDKKQTGPFKKVYIDVGNKKLNNDKFLVGFNLEESKIYRIGINGLELTDTVDTSKGLRKELLNKIDISNKEEFKDCSYFGKIDEYALFTDKNNMFFVVNVLDDVMPIDSYPKFDTYKDLTAWYRITNGIKLFSTDMYTLTNNAEYVKLSDITDGVFNIKIEELSNYSKYTIENLLPSHLTNSLIQDFYRIVKKKLSIKFVPKYKGEETKEELLKENYVKFNFRHISSFHDKYPKESKIFEENIVKRCKELQKEYITSNPNYLLDLFREKKSKSTSNYDFSFYCLPIITQDYNENVFLLVLRYLGLSQEKMEGLKKNIPEVYNSWYQFCEKNFIKIKKMITVHRIEALKNMLKSLEERMNLTKDIKNYRDYGKDQKIFLETEIAKFENFLKEINNEIPDASSDAGVEW